MKYLLSPLSDRMIDQVRAAHEIETSKEGRNVFTYKDFQYPFRALYRRGFINIQTAVVLNKQVSKVYITDEGKSFLQHYKVPEDALQSYLFVSTWIVKIRNIQYA